MKRLLLLSALAVLAPSPAAQSPAFDLVIRNARIVDGTGAAWYRGDIALRGDTVVQVAAAIEPGGGTVLNAGGRVVAPGFIDIHTRPSWNLRVPTADNYVRQGVTTVMEGPDGSSALPLAPFLQKLDALQTSVNIQRRDSAACTSRISARNRCMCSIASARRSRSARRVACRRR